MNVDWKDIKINMEEIKKILEEHPIEEIKLPLFEPIGLNIFEPIYADISGNRSRFNDYHKTFIDYRLADVIESIYLDIHSNKKEEESNTPTAILI